MVRLGGEGAEGMNVERGVGKEGEEVVCLVGGYVVRLGWEGTGEMEVSPCCLFVFLLPDIRSLNYKQRHFIAPESLCLNLRILKENGVRVLPSAEQSLWLMIACAILVGISLLETSLLATSCRRKSEIYLATHEDVTAT